MELSLFTLSLLGVFILAVYKRLPLVSPYYFFLLFCLLYTLIPLLVINDIYPTNTVWLLSLSQRRDLLNIHLINVSVALIAFSFVYARKIGNIYKRNVAATKISLKITPGQDKATVGEETVFLICIFLLIGTAVLGAAYPWAYGRPPLINSFLSQIKVILSAVFCYFFARFGFSSKSIVILVGFVIITLLEGSRTSLIAITIALFVITGRNVSFVQGLKIILFGFVAFTFFVFIALYRLDIDISTLDFFDATFPIYIEGMYGSYMSLQAYEVMSYPSIAPTWGINYLVDPIIFLVPRFVFVSFGVLKDNFTVFGSWIEQVNRYLPEQFAPYGGFFFIAEAYAALPYLGPAIISSMFGYLTAYFEKKSFDGFVGRLLYLNFLVGFFMVFIKHVFAASSHFLFTIAVTSVMVVLFIRTVDRVLGKTTVPL